MNAQDCAAPPDAPTGAVPVTLKPHCVPGWPRLAWVARCDATSRSIALTHGAGLEVRDGFACEAVWAGRFAEGDFDRTDLVLGSGVRLRGDRAMFVSSGTTVDRLHSLATVDGWLVSNSLAALTQTAEAEVDPAYRGYYADFRSIVEGLATYRTDVATTAGPVRLTYFNNLQWDGASLVEAPKPEGSRRFDDFANYHAFLREALDALGQNMRDPTRTRRFTPLGTLSTGYDSPTVATLAREIGMEEAITFTRARGGDGDDGRPIAGHLGLRTIAADRDAWRAHGGCIAPFLSVNAYGEEVHYASLAASLADRVLFTGYHGDKAWAKDAPDLSANIVRGDPTGLSLSEFRLDAGFIHCPLPFLGVRAIADLHRISHSPEMAPWDVPGDYSRPICRRIVESAGVPRDLFGMSKHAASVVLWNRAEGFLPPTDRVRYEAWLRDRRGEWRRAGSVDPFTRRAKDRVVDVMLLPVRPLLAFAGPHALAPLARHVSRIDPRERPDPFFDHLFPWALADARRRYAT
jgi:hypothetical protein